jgi:hypothetical protein
MKKSIIAAFALAVLASALSAQGKPPVRLDIRPGISLQFTDAAFRSDPPYEGPVDASHFLTGLGLSVVGYTKLAVAVALDFPVTESLAIGVELGARAFAIPFSYWMIETPLAMRAVFSISPGLELEAFAGGFWGGLDAAESSPESYFGALGGLRIIIKDFYFDVAYDWVPHPDPQMNNDYSALCIGAGWRFNLFGR